jgi:methionyl-tRNA formyltransferase
MCFCSKIYTVKEEMNDLDKNIKIVFMGTPDFARESLQKLIESGYNIVGVFTNPDRPSGRGMKLKVSAVKEYALLQDIPVYQPEKLRNNSEVIEILNKLSPDLIVVVAYGKILPIEILNFPRYGCINVHGSLLPKYRGAAPMQWSIINGDDVCGITTMYMDEGMDTGDMLLKEEVKIEENDNFETIHDKLKVVGASLLIKTIEQLLCGDLKRVKQGDDFSIAPMIHKEMTKIDFNKKGRDIYNFVRGLSPYPGTYMECKDGRIYKVYKVEYLEDLNILDKDINISNGDIIYISKDGLHIKCSDGYIKILEVQPPSSKKMDINAFMAAGRLSIADKFI